jgi:hypothetical protein
MVYPIIRLCSFKLKSGIPPQEFYVMSFPDEAKQHIRGLTAKRDKTLINQTSLPVKSLYKALGLASSLIHIGKVSPDQPEQFWLYSPYPLPERMLSAILSHWIDIEFPNEPRKKGKVGITYEEQKLVMEYLSTNNLVWEKKRTSYTSDFNTHPNGTASLIGNDYILLPYIVAAKLSKPGLTFDLDGKKIQFHRAIESGANLISWEPLTYTNNGKTYYYSIFLKVTLILEPSLHYPRLDITPSVRRWLSIDDSQLSNNHGTNAYIRTQLNWGQALNPDDYTKYFISCRMLLKNNQPDWDENIAKLLNDLDIFSIAPQQILASPSAALKDNINIGLLYKDGMEPEHLVAKGLPTINTYELLQQIDNVLKDYLEPIYCQRQSNPVKKQRRKQKIKQLSQFFDLKKPEKSFDEPLSRKKEETEEAFQLRLEQFYQDLTVKQAQLRKAIFSCVGKHLTIWIWYINENNLEQRLKAIQYCLGLPEAIPGSYPFPEGLTVNIRKREAASLVQRLDLSTKYKPNSTERKKASEERIKLITDTVEPVKSELLGKVGVWFELYGKEFWNKYPWCDPKNANRLGFVEAGMGSQFITPERKNYHQKAISSFIDLLRFLGVHMTSSHIQLANVKEDTPINEVAVYLIKRTSKTSLYGKAQLIPVMVKMSSLTAEISAIFPGLDSWVPYDEASIRINKEGYSFTNDAQGKARIRTFIEQTLNKKELKGKPTILYCEAENLRQVWTWLQDTQISANGLSFAERENPVFVHMPGLRVIRCRSGDETAEWYGTDGVQVSGFASGIFKNPDNDRVFQSIGTKSVTMRRVPKALSRIENPEKFWQHPSVVEIAIGYCQEDDNFLDLAAIAHESRHGVLQYEDFLERPRVLHYAKQMTDYVLMLDDDSQPD